MESVRQSKMTSCINIICSDTLNVYLSSPYNQISDNIENNKTSIRSGEPCFHQQFNQMLSMMQQCCLHCTSFTAIDLQNIYTIQYQPTRLCNFTWATWVRWLHVLCLASSECEVSVGRTLSARHAPGYPHLHTLSARHAPEYPHLHAALLCLRLTENCQKDPTRRD